VSFAAHFQLSILSIKKGPEIRPFLFPGHHGLVTSNRHTLQGMEARDGDDQFDRQPFPAGSINRGWMGWISARILEVVWEDPFF